MTKIITSEELQEELEITSYDVYQYLRRGLPQAHSKPGMYELDEARAWINGFGAREAKREAIKEELLHQLTDEEAQIVSEPKGNAQYAVVWGMTSRRQAVAIQRAMYMMVQYSTSRADNLVYLSTTTQQAKEVQEVLVSQLGELAQGFQAITIQDLAGEIVQEESVERAVQLLENKPALQEKYSLIYRTIIVEEFEKFKAVERHLLELLTTHYGEYLVNIS